MSLRLALIADTHLPRGDRFLPKRCLDTLRAADLIVHAGDFSHQSVLADLRELGPVAAVHGNVDSASYCVGIFRALRTHPAAVCSERAAVTRFLTAPKPYRSSRP